LMSTSRQCYVRVFAVKREEKPNERQDAQGETRCPTRDKMPKEKSPKTREKMHEARSLRDKKSPKKDNDTKKSLRDKKSPRKDNDTKKSLCD
jgi:hypothetical protein